MTRKQHHTGQYKCIAGAKKVLNVLNKKINVGAQELDMWLIVIGCVFLLFHNSDDSHYYCTLRLNIGWLFMALCQWF